MRFLSIKLIALCILLPPLLYMGTSHLLEQGLQERFVRAIEEVSTGDPQPLLEGSVRLPDALRANIDRYLRDSDLVRYGLAVRVSVTSGSGKTLYPAPIDETEYGGGAADPLRIARENFALLSQGLKVQVETRLTNNRPLSNGILGFYLLAALATLLVHYRYAAARLEREDSQRRLELNRLLQREQADAERLEELQRAREGLVAELGALREQAQDERLRAQRNEGDLINEIETLESKLAENLSLESLRNAEIQSLREKIELIDKEQRRPEKTRLKAEGIARKRFTTLYKNIEVNDRAVEGFCELNEDLRLKAEEVIHQLNSAPEMVSVKRKVFGKKNRETVLEVVFAYRGRLYFRKSSERRVEILAIGTKNSQERELEFLAHL